MPASLLRPSPKQEARNGRARRGSPPTILIYPFVPESYKTTVRRTHNCTRELGPDFSGQRRMMTGNQASAFFQPGPGAPGHQDHALGIGSGTALGSARLPASSVEIAGAAAKARAGFKARGGALDAFV